MLSGETAKSIFERAQLPNEVLGRIWNLADTEQRGSLGLTEFIIAMHLLASYKSGTMRALPQILPVGLYEAAARRGVSFQGNSADPTSRGLQVLWQDHLKDHPRGQQARLLRQATNG